MKKFLLKLLTICATSIFLGACVSLEGVKTTSNAREYVTQDLETQIMFNLIRAKNGLPFAQYEVQQIQAVVTNKATPSGSIGRNTTTSQYPNVTQITTSPTGRTIETIAGAATAATETIVRPYGLSFGYERDNALTVVINPIYDDPSVYKAYVTFLNARLPEKTAAPKSVPTPQLTEIDTTTLKGTDPQTGQPVKDKDGKPAILQSRTTVETVPGAVDQDGMKIHGFGPQITSIVESNTPPLAGTYIKDTPRYWEGSYYYIPREYTPQFAELWLSLVARKPPGAAGGAASVGQKTLRTLQNQTLNSTNAATLGP